MRTPTRSTGTGADAAAAELEELVPCAEEEQTHRGPTPSKRKRRQRQSKWRREEDGSSTLDIISTDPPVHQLGTGSNRVGRMPTND